MKILTLRREGPDSGPVLLPIPAFQVVHRSNRIATRRPHEHLGVSARVSSTPKSPHPRILGGPSVKPDRHVRFDPEALARVQAIPRGKSPHPRIPGRSSLKPDRGSAHPIRARAHWHLAASRLRGVMEGGGSGVTRAPLPLPHHSPPHRRSICRGARGWSCARAMFVLGCCAAFCGIRCLHVERHDPNIAASPR